MIQTESLFSPPYPSCRKNCKKWARGEMLVSSECGCAIVGHFKYEVDRSSFAVPGPGAALEFVAVLNGDGAHVAFPPELLRGLDEVTVEGWFKWERFAGFGPALSAGKPWQMLGFNNWGTDSTLQFLLYDTARNLHRIRVSDILELGRWYHLAGVVDDQGLRLYLNGEQVGRSPSACSVRASRRCLPRCRRNWERRWCGTRSWRS